jgi:D-glycero-alpha-D-manno-heptose-7-phosphate kinase
MIITRSPLRISLGGGGTDLPSYYQDHEGFLIAAAIDKYVYLTVHKTFGEEFILKYSQLEKVRDVEEIKHPIVREALKMVGLPARYLEISSMADIPAGTGLGSSGSFTTALLKALHTLKKEFVPPEVLAEEACSIELGKLKEPIGKQDQYIAACGGLTCFTFRKDGRVVVEPLKMSNEAYYNLEDNLLLFFTGFSRSASQILKDQDEKSKQADPKMIENLHFTKELGQRSRQALEQGNLEAFGRLMHEHWEHKRRRSQGMSNPQIDAWYEAGMKNGALGGKLIGAGGGGFLMFYAADKTALRRAMGQAGLEEVRFHFDPEGTRVVVQ